MPSTIVIRPATAAARSGTAGRSRSSSRARDPGAEREHRDLPERDHARPGPSAAPARARRPSRSRPACSTFDPVGAQQRRQHEQHEERAARRSPPRGCARRGRAGAGDQRGRLAPRGASAALTSSRPSPRSRLALPREPQQRDDREHERRHVAVLGDGQDRRGQRVHEADRRCPRRASPTSELQPARSAPPPATRSPGRSAWPRRARPGSTAAGRRPPTSRPEPSHAAASTRRTGTPSVAVISRSLASARIAVPELREAQEQRR